MRYLLVILSFLAINASAVQNAPTLLRACINYTDSIVTVTWDAPTDVCGSFTNYSLYGNENGGAFFKIADIPDIAIVEYPHTINNKNAIRSYFIRVLTLCDGQDSATSDTLYVDIVYPANIQLDSVSYDVATQNIIAGWKKNPSKDTKAYQLYDYSSGNGDSIGYTIDTFFTVTTNPNNVFPVVIATLDSCNLTSLISSPHKVMKLNSSIDTCKREIALSWTSYVGWQSIDSQFIMVSVNGGSFTKHSTISGGSTSFTYDGFVLGDTFCFFIRASTESNLITSSSNISCIETRKLEKPSFVYLERVSVDDNKTISIEWTTDNTKDQAYFKVFRGLASNMFDEEFNVTANTNLSYNLNDVLVDVQNEYYSYAISTINKCEEVTATSNTSNSILLKTVPIVSHNNYSGWDGSTDTYTLQKKNGSTWNDIETDVFPIASDYSDSSGCFRIRADEKINQYGSSAISYSNESCIQDSLRFYVPTGINPQSENNSFVVLGTGIDHSKSTYEIYNRWGMRLAQNNTNIPWKAEYQGSLVPPGIYVYIVHLYGYLGEKESAKGTVYVIR
ncbi:MAG: gliding motility-associated C-terminal domain-containing protein [Bacteroidia bacterium]|nr:gliding motility-associated C-terminal domain-containing protein [Bacteroidia bacterium]NNJ56725.1 hypothetical protein [Bacteroidia bacterium]